jgi:serine protease Do
MKPIVRTAVVGMIGAAVGSTAIMLSARPDLAAAAMSESSPEVSQPITDVGSDQARIVAAVKRDEPSVVALDVEVNGKHLVAADPFSQFFRSLPNVDPNFNPNSGQGQTTSPGQMEPYREKASGSGFVYSKDGLIVTNAHVVKFGAGSKVKITAIFKNGDRIPAHVYAADPAADVALVKVDNYAKLPPPLELGNSSAVEAGQWAIAIGEPFALHDSVSVGVVSGFERTETIGNENGSARTFNGLLQTSAPINPGNSGGPLIDFDGRVIGINQSVASPQTGAQGIGFAVPVDTVKQQVAMLERHPGEMNGPPTPYLGISMAAVNDTVRRQLNYRGNGVAVEGVYQGGPADLAGLQPGDVIQKIDGRDITEDAQVRDAVRASKPGKRLRLQVWNSGLKRLAVVSVGTAPSDFVVGQAAQPQSFSP